MSNKWKNIFRCRGYSFRFTAVHTSQALLRPGETISISGSIRCNGFRKGTVYVVVKLADAYDHLRIVTDSDRDAGQSERQAMRLTDIGRGESKKFNCILKIPLHEKPGVLDLKAEIWTPDKLYMPPVHYLPYCFDETGWKSTVEILPQSNSIIKIAIAFSFQSEEHISWIKSLASELRRYDIESTLSFNTLHPGESIAKFMEQLSLSDICIVICSDSLIGKANSRKQGAGYEAEMLSTSILNGRRQGSIIPILRDNSEKKLPLFLGSAKYIDMDVTDWNKLPLLRLVEAVRRLCE